VSSTFSGTSVSFKLYDIVNGTQMSANKNSKELNNLFIKDSKSNLREVAHKIADYVYERITNERGYFNTKIVYVETSYGKVSSKRKTRLVQIDHDGFNPIELTNGEELVLNPRFHPDSCQIAYITYNDKGTGPIGKSAAVVVGDRYGSRARPMLSKSLMQMLVKKNNNNPVQMTYAPRFSPDGKKAVMAIIIDGTSAIYILDLKTNKLKQLTEHGCIDTSPCFTNDGRILFTSNRPGKESIFIMNADGSGQTKISMGTGKYSQPMASSRGDLLVFSKQCGGTFYIGVMRLDGSGERLIAQGYLVEAPCVSSNGRYIVYSAQGGPGQNNRIVFIDITGNFARVIKTRADAAYPAWSPSKLSR
jgi:TolB protein